MKINLNRQLQTSCNDGSIGFDVLMWSLPQPDGKSLVRVYEDGLMSYQVQQSFRCISDALSVADTAPPKATGPTEILTSAIYSVTDLKALRGRNFAEFVRPCAFQNGQWTGEAIIKFCTMIGLEKAKVAREEASKRTELTDTRKQKIKGLQKALASAKKHRK